MSTFSVRPYRVVVEPHPNADAIEICRPDGTLYTAITLLGRFKTGDEAIYVPEGAVVPENVLRVAGFWDEDGGKGMLSGSNGDRVKAIRLRGILSQGIYINVEHALELTGGVVPEDGDWAELLGIVKYQPPIPMEMSGKVYHQPGLRGYTDIESAKNYPDVLVEGEQVRATEKLHGTNCSHVLLRDADSGEWGLHVSSKGMASKGMALEDSEANVYWRAAREVGIYDVLMRLAERYGAQAEVAVFGEVLGVQDLMYGLAKGQIAFRAFELRVDGRWIDADESREVLEAEGVPVVPLLYSGPYSMADMWELAEGKTTGMVAQAKMHVREGVVVRPVVERYDDRVGRVILKFVGEGYLTKRKSGTEYE